MLLFKGKRIFSDVEFVLRYAAVKAIGGLNLPRGGVGGLRPL